MAKFVKLTSADGADRYINPEHVAEIKVMSGDQYTTIKLSDGSEFLTEEKLSAVKSKLSGQSTGD